LPIPDFKEPERMINKTKNKPKTKNKSIFIIENDVLYSFFLMTMLQDKIMYRTREFLTVDEACEDIRQVKPGYVIVNDDPAKGIHAQASVLKLKALSPGTKIIVMSCDKTPANAVDLIRSGADHYLCKNKDLVEKLIYTLN